jgi:hypothetical protein
MADDAQPVLPYQKIDPTSIGGKPGEWAFAVNPSSDPGLTSNEPQPGGNAQGGPVQGCGKKHGALHWMVEGADWLAQQLGPGNLQRLKGFMEQKAANERLGLLTQPLGMLAQRYKYGRALLTLAKYAAAGGSLGDLANSINGYDRMSPEQQGAALARAIDDLGAIKNVAPAGLGGGKTGETGGTNTGGSQEPTPAGGGPQEPGPGGPTGAPKPSLTGGPSTPPPGTPTGGPTPPPLPPPGGKPPGGGGGGPRGSPGPGPGGHGGSPPGAKEGPMRGTFQLGKRTEPGFPALPAREAVNFSDVQPNELPPGTKLYRCYDPNWKAGSPNGGYWSLQPPASEADWRGGSAVLPQWGNSGNMIEELTLGPQGMKIWQGTTAPQNMGGGLYMPGGDQQVWIPPGQPPGAITGTWAAPWAPPDLSKALNLPWGR